MIEGEYIDITKSLFWQSDFSPHGNILYIYVIRAESAWYWKKTEAFVHWKENQTFLSLSPIMKQWNKHDYF